MRKVREEVIEREARCLQLANKSNNNRMAAKDLKESLEERRGSCASQCNGCCFDSVVEQLFTMGATRARQQIQACRKNSSGGSRPQQLLHIWQEEKKEEENGRRSKCTEQPVPKWVRRRQVGAMKAFRLVLFLKLLGSRMQRVKAVEQESSTHQAMDRILGKVSVLRADSSNICRINTARWRTPEPLERTRQGEDPRTFEENSRSKEPSTFEGRSNLAERWRIQEKRKEEKWKKSKKKKNKVKYRKKEMVEEVKRVIISLSMMRLKKSERGEGKQKK